MLGSSSVGGDASPLDIYRMLEAYYLNNGLYDAVQQAFYESGIWTPGMKPLRNPAKRTVEFHVTHIWPGAIEKALPIVTDNARIIAPLYQVYKWSNWAVKKQLAARWFALYGDWFCKVATSMDVAGNVTRVFLQNIKPELVTDFEQDERGNVVYIRLDIPQGQGMTHTEVWSLADGFRLFVHKLDTGRPIDQLGRPAQEISLEQFGIDFVPFVHASFIDMGDKRGLGVFMLALDKIDEANRMTTRLHQLIFRYNKPTIAILANAVDNTGRPLPAPRMDLANAGKIDQHDDDIKSFPGNSSMQYLVAPINYEAHLNAINAQMKELEEDLPELTYYRQKELSSSVSGLALRLMLSQAVDRTLEARGNIESALVKAGEMALSMGMSAGIFKRIGKYEAGDFDHAFAEREVIPYSVQEKANTISMEVSAGVPLVTAARRQGWTEAELNWMEADRERELLRVADPTAALDGQINTLGGRAGGLLDVQMGKGDSQVSALSTLQKLLSSLDVNSAKGKVGTGVPPQN